MNTAFGGGSNVHYLRSLVQSLMVGPELSLEHFPA